MLDIVKVCSNQQWPLIRYEQLPLIGMTREGPATFLAKSLAALQLDYVDLYLVHSAIGCKYHGDDQLFPMTAQGELDIDVDSDICAVWEVRSSGNIFSKSSLGK